MRHSPNLVNPSQGANETPKCDKQVAFIAAYATATPVVEGPISGCLLHDRLMGRRSVAYGWGPLWPPVAGGRTTGHLSTTPGTHKGQYRLNKEKGGSMMERDGRPQGPSHPHPRRPRFTRVGFFGTPPSGADGGRKSGDTPETPSGAAPLHPASKKPTPVKPPPPLWITRLLGQAKGSISLYTTLVYLLKLDK